MEQESSVESSASKKPLTILFSPLNWGLGHASRGIYLVQAMLDAGHRVILAADGEAYFLLHTTFPSLELVRFPFFSVQYSRIFPIWLKMFFSLPGFFYTIHREHRMLKKWLAGRAIDLIVSDNRYGIYHKHIYSVFITHQLYIKVPWPFRLFEPIVFSWNKRRMRKFREIWVPDYKKKENILAGMLSHPPGHLPTQVQYLGPLSRFMYAKYGLSKSVNVHYDVVVVLSGPEPQRTILERILIRKLRNRDQQVLMLRGMPWKKSAGRIHDNIRLVTHLDPPLFYTYLEQARYIIARAGYSTIMDLAVIGKAALLIPTPGQPEQEYLAGYHTSGNRFVFMEQQRFDIDEAFARLDDLNRPEREGDPEEIQRIIRNTCQAIYQSINTDMKNPDRKPT